MSSNDLLEWWEDDAETDLVLLYLESFGNPRKFGSLARRVARRKPILALKAGTTSAGARAASSHTAALAGSEVAVDALFRQAGVIRARTLEELVDAASFFSTQPLPAGRRVAVLTNAGGLGILCADACDAAGLELPELAPETREALAAVLPAEASTSNPVDLLGSATAATYEAALPLVLRDPGIDSVIALFVPPVVASAEDVAAAIVRAGESESQDKPLLAVVLSADGTPPALEGGSRIASFSYPESAARTLALGVERAEWLRRPLGDEPRLDGHRRGRGALGGRARARGRRRVARPGRRARRPRGLRDPARAGARRLHARGGGRRRARARPPRGREDRPRRASTRRSSAASRSTSRTTTTSAPPRSGSARRCSSSRC